MSSGAREDQVGLEGIISPAGVIEGGEAALAVKDPEMAHARLSPDAHAP